MNDNRMSWPDYFMSEAEGISKMTTCPSRSVGAAFVRDKIVVIKGFNGPPRRWPHPKTCPRKDMGCKSGERLDACVCVHAEVNGIFSAARFGISLDGTICFCTTQPCVSCMGALVNVGVTHVVFKHPYPHDVSELIAARANVQLLHIDIDRSKVDALFK